MSINSKILITLKESEEEDENSLFKPRRVNKRLDDRDKKIPKTFVRVAEKQNMEGEFNSVYYQNLPVDYLNGIGVHFAFIRLLTSINKEIHRYIPNKYPNLKEGALHEFKSMIQIILEEWDLNLTEED